MSYGFGSTVGTGNNRLSAHSFALATGFSCWMWVKRTSGGYAIGGGGRVFDRNGSALTLELNSTDFSFGKRAVSNQYYAWAAPALNEWESLGISVDTSATGNDPTAYANGVVKTLGSGITQSGADFAWDTTSTTTYIGDRQSAGRNFGGQLADFAIWSEILTAEEFYLLHNGVRPHNIRPDKLLLYYPLDIPAARVYFSGQQPG
jgi:hypothetical protein